MNIAKFFLPICLSGITLSAAHTEFKAERLVQAFEATVGGTPEQVFPLLCPVREYDWIPGWKCELIHSASGVVENNCIFRTNFPGEGPAIWTTSLYDPASWRVEYVRVVPGRWVVRLDIRVQEQGAGRTRVEFRNTYTGLGQKGNEAIRRDVSMHGEERFRRLMGFLETYLAKHPR